MHSNYSISEIIQFFILIISLFKGLHWFVYKFGKRNGTKNEGNLSNGIIKYIIVILTKVLFHYRFIYLKDREIFCSKCF